VTTKNRRLRAPVFLCLSQADGQLYSPMERFFASRFPALLKPAATPLILFGSALQTRILPFE
jgi:hypothetical protein